MIRKYLIFSKQFFAAVAGVLMSSSMFAQSQTFNFTGAAQSFTVPCGVDTLFIQTWGAQGGSGAIGGGGVAGGSGGLGGYSEGFLLVNSGDVLNVFVGGQGATPTGGFNGGASGGTQNSGGGGGATDVRVGGTAESNRVITAGGGGGGGRGGCDEGTATTAGTGGNGGVGGGGVGSNGNDSPTSGGVAGGGKGGNFGATQGASGPAGIGCGGFLGTPGNTATTGTGATGGGGQSCCCSSGPSIPGGGGGGGGQLGGGGGGGGSAGTTGCSGNSKGAGGGGGGGSSFVGGVVSGTSVNGIWLGNGMCTISWADPTLGTPILSNVSLCENDVVAITIPAITDATSYTWSSTGSVAILSGQGTNSITISSAGTGSGTLSVFASNNCGAGPTANASVTVFALPTVTISASATDVCVGEVITLSGVGADTYVWDNGVIDGAAFTPSAITYTVIGTDLNGCTNTASQAITINQLPVVGLTATMTGTFCGGQDVTLTGSPAGGTYSQVSGPASALTGNIFNAPSQGSWTIEYLFTDANGCENTETIDFTIDCMLGLDLISANGKMNVYPNPNNGVFTIKSDIKTGGTLELFNLAGQLVHTEIIDDLSEKVIEIKGLTPGIYNMTIKSGDQLFSGRMSITK